MADNELLQQWRDKGIIIVAIYGKLLGKVSFPLKKVSLLEKYLK